MSFKEIIVVEGRDDTRRLKEVFGEIETFETGGSALDAAKIEQLKTLAQLRGIIIFTDPDFPGQKIRQAITEAIPTAKHAYLDKADAKPKKGRGIGVEHANAAAIKKAMEAVMTPVARESDGISQSLLVALNLIGHSESKKRRELLAQRLGIGYVNGKQLMKRLNMFGITEAQVKNALDEEFVN